MNNPIPYLLRDIFNHDFSSCAPKEFASRFFARPLTWPDLEKISARVRQSAVTLDGKSIPAAIHIKGKNSGTPFVILAQLHGNEPAGVAGILLAMALSQAGLLERDVLGVIGNPLAAAQYFDAWQQAPEARQETRDAYRCGLSESGSLLPDMNRIPVDFATRPPTDHHTKRAQELYTIAQHCNGMVDIHSARGDMVCITDHKRDADLQHSPIRAILTELAEAISAHASASVTVQTFKTITQHLPNIQSQVGIEAGRHESKDAPYIAASFTLSLLYTLGLTKVAPLFDKEDGIFKRYSVRPRITYADLVREGELQSDDRIYMAAPAEEGNGILLGRYAPRQYEEMEPIKKGQIVAVAVPSGAVFRAPYDFSGIFLSKSAALYDKDPNVGPWPVDADKLATTKFCYPCDVSQMKINFGG